MFFELVSILFAIVPDYGNEYMTKENKNWTSFKNFAPKLNWNHNIYLNNDCRKTFETDWQENKFPTICAQRKSRKKVGEKITNQSHFYYFQWRMWFIIPASRRSCFLFTLQGCFTFCFSCPVELLQLTIFLEFGLMKYSISLDSVKSMYKMPSFFYLFVVLLRVKIIPFYSSDLQILPLN